MQIGDAAQIAMANDIGDKNLAAVQLSAGDIFKDVFRRWIKCVKPGSFFDRCDDFLDPEEVVAEF